MSQTPIQPNRPERDIGVLSHLISSKQWDAVLGGSEAITRYPLISREQCQINSFEFETVTLDPQVGKQVRRCQQGLSYKETLGQQFCLEMVKIPSGTFLMGAAESGKAGFYPYLQHKATLTSFFISKYPITQMQWLTVAVLPPLQRMLPLRPSYCCGLHHPVEQVSWYEATEFCLRLTRLTGRLYRLPTEAEWEYACRAGSHTPFHFGNSIMPELANYNVRAGTTIPHNRFSQTTTPVGSFPFANAFGLCDMHGNVWEWCNDKEIQSDLYLPVGLRGGAWSSSAEQCHSSFRYSMNAQSYSNDVGFRVVCKLAN